MLGSMKNHGIVDRLHQLDRIFAIYSVIFVAIPHRYIAVVSNSRNMVNIFYQLQDNA